MPSFGQCISNLLCSNDKLATSQKNCQVTSVSITHFFQEDLIIEWTTGLTVSDIEAMVNGKAGSLPE
jgi:hypothetical protein